MKLESRVPHHILPVEHLKDVAEQLAAGLRLLPLLQVKLQLLRHQRQEDLAAICGEGGGKKTTHIDNAAQHARRMMDRTRQRSICSRCALDEDARSLLMSSSQHRGLN